MLLAGKSYHAHAAGRPWARRGRGSPGHRVGASGGAASEELQAMWGQFLEDFRIGDEAPAVSAPFAAAESR